jgi:alkylation response protein AidB-like acyl-CoA dehydrogenase
VIDNRYIFDEDHQIFRDSVRRFVASEIVPYYEDWCRERLTPRELYATAAEYGLLSPQIPEAYGGPGLDFRFNAIINEEINYAGCPCPTLTGHSDLCTDYILDYADEAFRETWLPRLVAGSAIVAVAMTEPGTGSDLKAIRTTARRSGDNYIINGAKTFITGGHTADLIVVVCRTNTESDSKHLSLLVVEGDREGMERGRKLEKIGLHASDTSELSFTDVTVPAGNRIGEEGAGMSMLMEQLPQERLSIAIGALALAQRAYEDTVDYTTTRKVFGQPVAAFQNTRFQLAELKTRLRAAWAFVDQCIMGHVAGSLSIQDAAMAKLLTTELQGDVVDRCLQLFGGYGYMQEYPISRMYLDARVSRIYGGTSEIMKELIGRDL